VPANAAGGPAHANYNPARKTLARIELAPEVGDDIDRILQHLEDYEAAHVEQRLRELIDALSVLEHNPAIGRLVQGDLRELIIGSNARGYVALYCYIAAIDTVFVLALRSQREAGYTR